MKIHTSENILTVQFEGFERFWALKSKQTIEFSNITKITWHEGVATPIGFNGFRAPGTNIPGRFQAGSLRLKNAWELRYLQFRQPGYLTIETKLQRYREVALTIDKATAQKVSDWFNRNKSIKNFA